MMFGNLVNYENSVDLLEYCWRTRHTQPTIIPSSFQNIQGCGKDRRKEMSVADFGRSKQ